jgi:quercetin dioxygenase-like cupin family protein
MALHILKPTVVQAAGNKPKQIEEFVGRVNSRTEALSIARMRSPAGWVEPGQTPEFDEFTLVLGGMLRVTTRTGAFDVQAGQAIIAPRGQWCSTVLRSQTAPSTSPSACPPFRHKQCIEIQSSRHSVCRHCRI